VGSGSERLVSSDVGKRHCDCDNGVLSFRKSEAEQEKLESAVHIGDRIRAKNTGAGGPGFELEPWGAPSSKWEGRGF